MEDGSQLWDLYQEWKRLTESEGTAILGSDWQEVSRCQKAKQLLQPAIIRVTENAQRALIGSPGASTFEGKVRQHVNELIQLESRNSATLQERLDTAREERQELDRTSRQLRQVHQSYGGRGGAGWNQYS